ncbi:MAG: ethanolamine ammonia-lyase subunit EutB, partial [Lachnospiraceae bacterium]|nr:ethanolamine ammonia-lyase subunit EutB [Lachnospiraceae bacterium]
PQGDDVMLMYQSTGYHDIAAVRQMLGKKPIPEFADWLKEKGIWVDGKPGTHFGDPTIFAR